MSTLLSYRRASSADVFPLMRLYQLSCTGEPRDPVLLDCKKLDADIRSADSLWIVGERDGQPRLLLSILLDESNRLARIGRLAVDPEFEDGEDLLLDAFPLLVESLRPRVDLLYTTTRTVTLRQQELTLRLGFKVLGIFPNAPGEDPSQLNGLTGYFFGDVLTTKRKTGFRLHPDTAALYEIVRRECGLGAVEVMTPPAPVLDAEPLPTLELLEAPAFVTGRFAKLKARQSSAASFYPFQVPNVLITDPAQRVEIFARFSPDRRFAALIGEHIELGVDPTALYDAVARKLGRCGVTYLEVICDAGDVPSIDCLVRGGFLPCAYIPCFKRQGDTRRDYVVLARAFERLFSHAPAPAEVSPVYLDYLTAYHRLEERTYLARLRPRG